MAVVVMGTALFLCAALVYGAVTSEPFSAQGFYFLGLAGLALVLAMLLIPATAAGF